MMVEQWIAYIVLVTIIVIFGLLIKCMSVIKEQSVRIRDYEKAQKNMFDNQLRLQRRINSVEKNSDQLRGSIELLNTNVSSILNERKACNPPEDMDIGSAGDTDGDTHSCVEYFGGMDKIATVFNGVSGDADGDSVDIHTGDKPPIPVNGQNLSKEPPTYRWIFPSDHGGTINCIMGEWYLVVGRIRTKLKPDGNPMIYSDDAMWNGYQFVTAKDERFDEVLAYIKPPQSGDIMERIVELALKKE